MASPEVETELTATFVKRIKTHQTTLRAGEAKIDKISA